MSGTPLLLRETLPPHPSSAGRARAVVTLALEQTEMDQWVDAARLAVTELVTNSLVHAATPVLLDVRLDDDGLRVEIGDGSLHQPVRRDYSATSNTGRGLRLLDEVVTEWGSFRSGPGKVVWFELRYPGAGDGDTAENVREPGATADRFDRGVCVEIELLNVPLLMHSAWQEHASAVLREYLLVQSDDEDDLSVFVSHAEASDAMNLLYEQIPSPDIDGEPDAVMATAVEPGVSEERLVIRVPEASVDHFETLGDLLGRATDLADSRMLLVPPTQPEIRDMRAWLCRQIRDQHRTGATAVRWESDADIRETVPGFSVASRPDTREISESPRALLATDEASLIVAVSATAVDLLGYRSEQELLGRRVIAIVPRRYHQAHIAGTTLHMVNGRDPLLNRPVTVPVVLADGTEQPVDLLVVPRDLPDGHRLFVAEFLGNAP